MLKKIPKLFFLIILFALLSSSYLQAQQRFPKPEFDSGYVQPDPTQPEPRAMALEYFDVLVLLAVLSLASWLAVKKRSRRGLLWLSVFTLIYFGFYRDGCICSIGAIQNVVLSIFDPGYAISITALLFVVLPLLFALFFGRVFCAAGPDCNQPRIDPQLDPKNPGLYPGDLPGPGGVVCGHRQRFHHLSLRSLCGDIPHGWSLFDDLSGGDFPLAGHVLCPALLQGFLSLRSAPGMDV
jgi:hypothetical protein